MLVRKLTHVPMEPVVVNGAIVDTDQIFAVLDACQIVTPKQNVENMAKQKSVH